MHFEGEFRVPGTPDAVMGRFADVERMARCMPGAVIEGRGDDGSYLGAMVVAFGPKKINFRGRASHEFDTVAHTGTLTGRGAADMRAARIGVKVTYTVRADPDAATATSVVALVSDADLTGVLADFARTGGIPVANALMAGFAKRMAEEFAAETPAVATAAPRIETVVPLAAHGLLWDIIKAKLMQFARWLHLVNTEGKHP
jgi:carbon monoxide dehydrogenase subunit G